jgi:uncharacterized membrane protein YagU involved in acid resistance
LKNTSNKPSATKTILLSGFVAGTLDILAAFFVYSLIMKVATPVQILQGISATAVGKTTIQNAILMAIAGLFIHYVIAYCFAIGYFLVYPQIKFLHRNVIASGLLYGMIVWTIMNLIIVPLSNGHFPTIILNPCLRAIIILMICVGLPISIITSKYYKRHA